MDPNETYRLLCEAIGKMRGWMSGGVPDGAEYDAQRVIEHWDDLDGWMRKSGFPPVAWNNPAGTSTTEMVDRQPMTWTRLPIHRQPRPPADTSWINTTERVKHGPLCRKWHGSGFCGLERGHEGGCEW